MKRINKYILSLLIIGGLCSANVLAELAVVELEKAPLQAEEAVQAVQPVFVSPAASEK